MPEPNGQTFMHGFYAGVRDPGYMLLHAANLARVHPDPAVRDEFRAQALDVAVNYFARLQRLQSTGGGFYFHLDGMVGPDGKPALTTQPFQEGLLQEGLIAVHRLTGDATVAQAVVKNAEHLYQSAYNPSGWRAPYYFVGGGWFNADGTYTSCAAGCGAAATPFPPADLNQVAEARHLSGTIIHAFGYAYLLTGDAKFRQWGDEVFDAAFSGADGYRGLAWARAKEYDESYRSAGKYLAWRLSDGTPLPTPSPTPIAPTPTPTATPGVPTPTPAAVSSGFIGGHVVSNGLPVAGARVVLFDSGGVDPVGSTLTGVDGRYSFEVNDGQRGVIRPDAAGFTPASCAFQIAGSFPADLDFVSVTATPTPTPQPTPSPAPTPSPTPTPTPTPEPSPTPKPAKCSPGWRKNRWC